MPIDSAMSLMTTAEFVLWATLGVLFWTKGLQSRFPAMSFYLALRVGSMPVLLGLFHAQAQPWGHIFFPVYFYAYWTVYIASAVSLYFICVEVFRSALSSFSGLIRLGSVVFRWAALASVIMSLIPLSSIHRGPLVIPDLAVALMRSVSVLELCLLAFLCLCMNALRLSVRDLAFGIALGFGVMSSNDFILSSLLAGNRSLVSPLQFVYESLVLTVIGFWVVFFALPEPARKPVVVPVNSTIYRWNEIASALGHTGTQVATQQPASGFFLTDVERVVEKVLNKNLQNRESEL